MAGEKREGDFSCSAKFLLSLNKIRCGSAESILRAVEITVSMRNELHIRRQLIQPYRGALLVAEPFLDEGCFRRAVICLAEYSEKGAVGFVLNSPTRYRLNELLEGMDGIPSIPVYCGGPVGTDHLFFLHDIASLPGAVEVATGLFANGDFDMLLDFLKSDEGVRRHVKFLVGYSGWSPGQLEGELKQEAWAVTAMQSPGRCLAAMDESFWRETVRGMGEGYLLWLNTPQEPSLN